MISNSTAIAEVFSRIDHKFDLMYSKRALCIGTSERAWKRVSSLRPVRTWQLWRRTTRKSASRRLREKARRRATETSSEPLLMSSLVVLPEFRHVARHELATEAR